jgi:hypothetical protein
MADKEFNTRIKHKRDTDTNWTINNPVLLDGEIIIVDTVAGTARTKIGDGMQTYTQLPFDCDFAETDLSNVSNTDFLTKAKSVNIVSSPFVLEITFEPSLSGQPFTITGGGFTYSGVVPASLTVFVDVPDSDTTYLIRSESNLNVFGAIKTTNYFGIYPVEVGIIPQNLSEASWKQISTLSEFGDPSDHWSIGDEKDVLLRTGEVLTFQIYGFEHDDLADGSGKVGITFGMKNLMAATRQMNSSSTNSGGYTGSTIYAWLRDTVFADLPADLRAIIKPVAKKTSAGTGATTILVDNMLLHLFSTIECYGVVNASVPGEGTQYPIFTNNTSRIKRLSNGTGAANSWYMRSPQAGNTSAFCVTINNGTSNTAFAVNPLGVCFGFCI